MSDETQTEPERCPNKANHAPVAGPRKSVICGVCGYDPWASTPSPDEQGEPWTVLAQLQEEIIARRDHARYTRHDRDVMAAQANAITEARDLLTAERQRVEELTDVIVRLALMLSTPLFGGRLNDRRDTD